MSTPAPKRRRRRPGFIAYHSACQNHRCCYCGLRLNEHPPEMTTVEHATPLALGGIDDSSNIVIACSPCNLLMGEVTAAFLNSNFLSHKKARRKFILRLANNPYEANLFTSALRAFHLHWPTRGHHKHLPAKIEKAIAELQAT